jgi:hypothetical protein
MHNSALVLDDCYRGRRLTARKSTLLSLSLPPSLFISCFLVLPPYHPLACHHLRHTTLFSIWHAPLFRFTFELTLGRRRRRRRRERDTYCNSRINYEQRRGVRSKGVEMETPFLPHHPGRASTLLRTYITCRYGRAQNGLAT